MGVDAAAWEQPLNTRIHPQPQGAVASTCPSVLTDIYDPDINLAIWCREPGSPCKAESAKILERDPGFQLGLMTSVETVETSLGSALRLGSHSPLVSDITRLVEMFSVLFDLQHVGLRLTALEGQMCPKFHIDRVPCRLITTYDGVATEWLPNDKVDRSKLGAAVPSTANRQGGLYKDEQDIAQLQAGEVALFKGESWDGNEGFGVVHRSPSVPERALRLLLTIDFGQ